MKVIIMGCGRVGEQLAGLMVDDGHEVSVIDLDPAALARLGSSFRGKKVIGVGFDRDVLLEAGIEYADAFAATSSSDNANIVAARVARNIFHVPKVVARLFDPRRAEIYRRLGLTTISSTTWGAARIRQLIAHSNLDPVISFGNGEVSILEIEAPPQLIGRSVKNINIPSQIEVTAITRDQKAFIPTYGTIFREGDLLHLTVLTTALERVEALLGVGEGV